LLSLQSNLPRENAKMTGRVIVCALGLTFALGCGAGPTDTEIARSVEQKIAADVTLGASHIDVSAQDGEVTLMGDVASATDASRAEDIAQRVEGVLRVRNHLSVTPSEPPPVASPPPPPAAASDVETAPGAESDTSMKDEPTEAPPK
jgi:hypothetical protein